jgi:hypothetical protein
MVPDAEIRRVLCDQLRDPRSSFGIGSFGAIAEFHRDADESLVLDEPERLTLATNRGALRIALTAGVVPLAYEALVRRPGRWQQGVLFCLPRRRAESHCRSVVTELGPDRDAIRPEDRDAVLFDVGLGAHNVDFCVRTRDAGLLALLRQQKGRSLLDPGSRAMGAIIEASPHRIAISTLGRAEVYQAIGTTRTPGGPHTHVLPRLLKSGRTHSANIPVPKGLVPCVSLYPVSPLRDDPEGGQGFDSRAFHAFEALLRLWGAAEYLEEKARALEALHRGQQPAAYRSPKTRLGGAALRVALRQARHTDAGNPLVAAWSRRFDEPRNRRGWSDDRP